MHTLRLGLCGLALLSLVAGAQQIPSEYEVKAAYLYTFAESAHWPAGRLRPGADLNIGVFGGDDDFLKVLRDVLAAKIINNHPLRVRRLVSPEEAKACHVVFFRSSEPTPDALISQLSKSSVLLVGEDKQFLNEGGMINLVLEDGKINYEFNAAALKAAGLHYAGANLIQSSVNSTVPDAEPQSRRSVAFRIAPEYPRMATTLKLAGVVQLHAVVRADGTVKQVWVIGGHPVLAEAAAAAIKQWRYQAAPKETIESIRVSFARPR